MYRYPRKSELTDLYNITIIQKIIEQNYEWGRAEVITRVTGPLKV